MSNHMYLSHCTSGVLKSETLDMKVIKPSDTRWLAHKWCVKAVKASYIALLVTLDNNQNFHVPEALGLYKALSKSTSFAAIYLLDYTLLIVANVQTKQLDLSMISFLVDAVLHILNDAITPVAY